MAKVKVFYDKEGTTLTVWFGDPVEETISEETGEEIILIRNKEGKVIGLEKLNYSPDTKEAGFAFEAVTV